MKKMIITLLVPCLLFFFILVGYGQLPQSDSVTYSAQDIDEQLIQANSTFGFHLYQEILKQDKEENIFISPSSIAIALAMTYNGASEETQTEMAQALQIQGFSLEELNLANASLKYVLEQADPTTQLTIANSL